MCRPYELVSARFAFVLKGISYLDKGVVEQKHDRGGPPGDLGVPEEVLANITHVADLGVAQTKSPM
jgi:hypothetical protein